MCGFSRARRSLHRPWRIPPRRGDQLLVIATRLYCVQVGIENLTNDRWGSVQQHLHHGVKLIKRAGCLFCLGVRLTCHVTELPFGVCMHWVRWMKLSAHLGGCVQISHGRVTSTEIQCLPGKHLLIPPFPFIIHLDSTCYGVFFFCFSIFFHIMWMAPGIFFTSVKVPSKLE